MKILMSCFLLVVHDEVPESEQVEVLQMLATHIKANYNAIKGMEAAYSFRDVTTFPASMPQIPRVLFTGPVPKGVPDDMYSTIGRGDVTFEWDKEGDQLHVHYVPNVPLIYRASDGREFPVSYNGDSFHWVMTPEHFLNFEENVKLGQADGKSSRVVTRSESSQSASLSRVVDPRDFFRTQNSPYWEALEKYTVPRRLRARPDSILSIVEIGTEDERQYKVTIEYPATSVIKQGRLATTVFDSECGFNVTRYTYSRTDTGQILEQRVLTYRQVDGVYVPDRFERGKYIERGGKYLKLIDRRLDLLSCKLNQPLDSDQFEMKTLGLKYGERVDDQLEGKSLVVDKGGRLTTVDQFVFEEPTPKVDGGGWGVIAIVNLSAVFVLAGAAWFFRKRMRRSK